MTETQAAFLDALKGLDLTSADGRAGIRCVLAEIERSTPGALTALRRRARHPHESAGAPT